MHAIKDIGELMTIRLRLTVLVGTNWRISSSGTQAGSSPASRDSSKAWDSASVTVTSDLPRGMTKRTATWTSSSSPDMLVAYL